jgi:hypothetical protein
VTALGAPISGLAVRTPPEPASIETIPLAPAPIIGGRLAAPALKMSATISADATPSTAPAAITSRRLRHGQLDHQPVQLSA